MQGGSSRPLGIILFVLIGASALVLGVLNTNKDILGPMRIDPNSSAQADASISGQQNIDALKKKDTDGDGLSDYDELYVYHTSPYIKDSDSDGVPDGVEVKNGTDPNCPQGKDCGTPAPVTLPPVADNADPANVNINMPSLNDVAPDTNTAPASTPDANAPAATPLTATQIRALLKQQGVGDNILGSIDDKTLMDLYNQSLSDAAQNNSSTNQ